MEAKGDGFMGMSPQKHLEIRAKSWYNCKLGFGAAVQGEQRRPPFCVEICGQERIFHMSKRSNKQKNAQNKSPGRQTQPAGRQQAQKSAPNRQQTNKPPTGKQQIQKQTANRQQTNNRPQARSHAVKRRVRYDRIAIVVVPLLLIIALIVFLCVSSCNQNAPTESSTAATTVPSAGTSAAETTDTASTPTATDESTTTAESSGTEKVSQVVLPAAGTAGGNLILINNDHAYSFPSEETASLLNVSENRNDAYRVSDLEVSLNSEALEHFNAMMEAYAAATGYSNVELFTGYRSEETQDNLYSSGSSSFPGGNSDYHSGRTVNLKLHFGSGSSDYYDPERYPDYSWIAENAADYGFVVRFPEGKESLTGENGRTYTYRYVGVPHATYIAEHDLCLEEYVEQIQSYTAEEPLEITVKDVDYSVFYISEDDAADLTVPTSAYTVSGDNIGGYIVTYTN